MEGVYSNQDTWTGPKKGGLIRVSLLILSRVCLRAWLEQDTVCPTCRSSLSEDLRNGRQAATQREEEPQEEERGRAPRLNRNMRNARNWLLRFNGASIASWLPTFSLELHQDDDARWISDAAELHRVVSHGAGASVYKEIVL